MDLHLWALPTELQLVIANCQLDIATRMSHWPLKFSMSKTNPPFPAVPGCQLVLFPLLCPHLMKWCYHPPGFFHQKPWVILNSSFPPPPCSTHRQVLSVSPPTCISHWSLSHLGHGHPVVWAVTAFYLVWAKALNLPPYCTFCPLIPMSESEP